MKAVGGYGPAQLVQDLAVAVPTALSSYYYHFIHNNSTSTPSQKLVAPNRSSMVSYKKAKKKYAKRYYNKKRKRSTKSLQKYLKPEAKQVLNFGTATLTPGVSNVGFSLCIGAPAAGTAYNERVGQQIQVYGVSVKGHCFQRDSLDTSKVVSYIRLRICLIKDRNPNGASLPSLGDVFNSAVDMSEAPINYKKTHKYQIVKEQFFDIDGILGEGYNFDWFVPLKLKMEFLSSSVNNYASISTNGLFLMGVISFETVSTTLTQNHVYARYVTKLHYIDG